MRKSYKKLTAVALTAAMTLGCTMTAFAANPTSGDVSGGGITGDGDFEGAEIEYPVVSITLPTTNPANLDYIVDPNDLIKSTLNASGDAINSAYAKTDFVGDTGVYFQLNAASGDVRGLYAEKSAPIRVKK